MHTSQLYDAESLNSDDDDDELFVIDILLMQNRNNGQAHTH